MIGMKIRQEKGQFSSDLLVFPHLWDILVHALGKIMIGIGYKMVFGMIYSESGSAVLTE